MYIMGQLGQYVGIDESLYIPQPLLVDQEIPMYFVAAFSFDQSDIVHSDSKIGKKRGGYQNRRPEHDFIYTSVKSHDGRISQNRRIGAICSLLVDCGISDDDYVIIDGFGECSQVEKRIRDCLRNYGIHTNGNLVVANSADRTYPIVNSADSIAYILSRLNGSSGFNNKEVPLLLDAQRYLEVYKTAR